MQKRLARPVINGKRSTVWYIVWTENGRSQRVSTGEKDKVKAEQKLALLESLPPPIDFDVSVLCEAYVQARIKAGKSEANLRTSLKPILKFFAHFDPRRIQQRNVREYIDRRRETGTVKDISITRELRTLRAALNWGVAENWMERAPVIKTPATTSTRTRFLTRDEFAQLESEITTLHLKVFIAIAINTASRAAKILALTWKQVDLKRNIIWFEEGTANKKTRPIPINKKLREELLFAQQYAVSDFVVEFNGARVKSVRKSFERAVARAGLHDVQIHDLRRTAASWALMAGSSFDDIAALLNDDVKVIQRHYAQFSPGHIRSVVDNI